MTAEQHLRTHGLRITEIRKRLYNHLRDSQSAVSHSDLEVVFTPEFDRVTIYRTLNSFLERGLLHKIPSDSGAAHYALCHEACNPEEHIDNHVHFRCLKCEQVVCLHDLKIPEMKLPGNFRAESAILVFEGQCDQCN